MRNEHLQGAREEVGNLTVFEYHTMRRKVFDSMTVIIGVLGPTDVIDAVSLLPPKQSKFISEYKYFWDFVAETRRQSNEEVPSRPQKSDPHSLFEVEDSGLIGLSNKGEEAYDEFLAGYDSRPEDYAEMEVVLGNAHAFSVQHNGL